MAKGRGQSPAVSLRFPSPQPYSRIGNVSTLGFTIRQYSCGYAIRQSH